MLTDTEGESSGRTTVLLSLLVAAVVLVIAVVKQRFGGERRAVGAEAAEAEKVSAG
jgi:GABA permease